MDKKEFIARRVAQELQDGDVVNLGIGLPTLVSNYIPEHIQVIFQAENGLLGVGEAPMPGQEDKDIFNAGAAYVTIKAGGTFFDSATSFGYIRGGHVDTTILGALQVDEQGNLANWMVPGKKVPGMGGAMDLVVGAKKVIVAMEHTVAGKPKIFTRCSFPLTAVKVVDLIITDMAVIEVTERGLLLKEIAPNCTLAQVQEATEAKLLISDKLCHMNVSAPEEREMEG